MKTVFAVSYDIKISGRWVSNWAKRFVLTNGDARAACTKLESAAKREALMDGDKPIKVEAVRVTEVVQVADDVLV